MLNIHSWLQYHAALDFSLAFWSKLTVKIQAPVLQSNISHAYQPYKRAAISCTWHLFPDKMHFRTEFSKLWSNLEKQYRKCSASVAWCALTSLLQHLQRNSTNLIHLSIKKYQIVGSSRFDWFRNKIQHKFNKGHQRQWWATWLCNNGSSRTSGFQRFYKTSGIGKM